MLKYSRKFILIQLLFVFVFVGSFTYKTQPVQADAILDNAQASKAKLESELSVLENEIKIKQNELKNQKGHSTSISRDISKLKNQIKKAKTNINSKNLIIKKLGGEINQKNTKINQLSSKIKNQKESLAQLIRNEREIEDKSMLVLILSRNTISEAYSDINSYASIKNSIKISVDKINNIKNNTEIDKKKLEYKKTIETKTKNKLEKNKHKVELTQSQKTKSLLASKKKEFEYQKVLKDKTKRRTQILNALFKLRDNSAIPFSLALKYANLASEKTGVRPAFLLAISTQESGGLPNGMVGINLGGCYLTNTKTGSGIIIKSSKKINRVMKASRDVAPFLKLTKELGRNPYKTAVSCPSKYGYGGAMGPLQFITSTWNLVKNKAASYLGINEADPWNPPDAFMAAAILLKGNGAKSGNYKAERDAACRYYSGRSCSAPKVRNAFYGNAVMAKAKIIQKNIDILQN